MLGTFPGWRQPIAWSRHLVNAARYTALGRFDEPPGDDELDERDFPGGVIPNFRLAYGLVRSPIPRFRRHDMRRWRTTTRWSRQLIFRQIVQ
jgi:hypothetical protein